MQTKEVTIENKKYIVNEDEFCRVEHKEYNNLRILDKVGELERVFSLICEIRCVHEDIKNLFIEKSDYGGFVPINCSPSFEKISLLDYTENAKKNVENHKVKNISKLSVFKNVNLDILYLNDEDQVSSDMPLENSILISKSTSTTSYTHKYLLSNSELAIYVPEVYSYEFYEYFFSRGYIQETEDDTYILTYDNLINLCIMVKNAGPQFEKMLTDNLHIIDRWTILDTGSTDDTINIINKVLVGKKDGRLYEEPFINFRDSRNRLLDLAGTSCKFNIMLDDTYVVKGDLRAFLTEVRGDQYSNSFTLYINSDDTQYGSNRVIKSNSGLRYIHTIHEVITDKNNINVVIPENKAKIDDRRFDYMEKRTQERKQLDLKLLFEEVEENPQDPRAYYYLAQTYNLLEDYENAYKYFLKRAEFTNSGFIQERVDAVFEAARVANFKLGRPWSECEELYNRAYKVDESRPEALYFIGIHYYLEGSYKKAYPYLKKGFEIGFPTHCQYSLKPTLSFHFLPKFLTRICYNLEEYKLGEEAALFFLRNNGQNAEDYAEIASWYNIFVKLNMYSGEKKIKNANMYNKPLFVFVADGGFNQWSGSTILEKGVGGSETYIIEIARYIQKSEKFQTIVFCNTPNGAEEIFENTIYKPLSSYYEFINTTYVDTCIISRFSEYLPVTYKGFSENVYLVVHDLTPSGIVIPIDIKLKNVFCLTEWHVSHLSAIFPSLANIMVPFYYGIDSTFYNFEKKVDPTKVKNKFIYSSFPNRGLLQLLQMWPKIIENVPTSTLHIYSDVNNKWSNDVEPQKMQQIRELLASMSDTKYGIHYHGWVNKNVLKEAWLTADIWFYPCTFAETFCLTALEAASSRTFVVTNDLAALQNTVGNRGCIIKGDPTTAEWQEEAIDKLLYYLISDINDENLVKKQQLIQTNFKWASSLSWESQANKLLDTYILPNTQIEYKGMYNWTNDLPAGEKKVFLEVLKYFNQTYPKKEKINVLEIGTYAGVSLINIINAIPNSHGIGVDMWSSYNENNLLENMDALGVEKSFYKNVSTFGLSDRITGIKSDSTDALTRFFKDGIIFDFIYVDGSHLLLDCYSDLVLSWIILEKGGVLAIDDYLYKNESMLDSPFEAINHFLKRYEGKYTILYKGYRVFLQKL
jgi:predicted O-methyltransferase YrrM